MGYAALRKVSKVLGIPSLHLKTYQRHDKRVTGRLWKQGWDRDVDFGGLMTCYIYHSVVVTVNIFSWMEQGWICNSRIKCHVIHCVVLVSFTFAVQL